jgi:hypothetical protein
LWSGKGAVPKAEALSASAQIETGIDMDTKLDSVFILLEYGRMILTVPIIAVKICNELTIIKRYQVLYGC